MSDPLDEPTDRQDDPEGPEDPRLSALIEALARGDAIDWQEAESAAGSAAEKERIRALSAISEVATFHRTWLAEAGIGGDLDEDEDSDDEVPTHWGELEILERVGRGSFGDVYKAREPRLDRIVALKLIRASARTPEREAETLREGRLLAKVRHPNVATVHGTAGADGRVGFWMEFLEGKNLQEILVEQKRFEPRQAAEIGISLCRALAAVHAQGIVHRDVKAQNVVRENDGRIVLTDFGVGRDAKDLEGEEPSLSGTPLYLAPELFEGKPPSPASDLYALGVLLFYLVTGEFPITGKSFDELRDAHRGRKRRWLKELRKDLPGTFVAAVERALDRDPEKRAGVGELEKELRRFLGEKLERRRRVRRWSFAFLVAASIAVWLAIRAIDNRNRELAEIDIRQADTAAQDGRMQEAVGFLETAKQRYPKLPGIYWRLMSWKSADGIYSGAFEAVGESTSVCERSSVLRDCHLVRAWSALMRLDYKAALVGFEEAGRIKLDDDIRSQIVQLHTNLTHPELGIKYAEALEDSAGVVEASSLASTLSAAGFNTKASEALSRFRQRFPKDPYVNWVTGVNAIASGDVRLAEAEFREMTNRPEDAGDSSGGSLLLAQAQMFQAKWGEAIVVLTRSASLDTQEEFSRNDAIRSILMATCYLHMGDPLEASRSLRAVQKQELIPANTKNFRNAALVAFEVGDLKLAKELAAKVRSISEQYHSDLTESFQLQLEGEFAWRQGKIDLGVDLLERAKKLRSDPQNALSMARVRLAEQRCDRAAPFLNEVIGKRGLIVDDFYTPWTIWNDANDLLKKCQAQDRKK